MTDAPATRPKPYTTRVSAGAAEVQDGAIVLPPIEVIYPGERAEAEVEYDQETGEARYVIVVSPAPGFRMRLLRLRYRLHLTRGGPKLTTSARAPR